MRPRLPMAFAGFFVLLVVGGLALGMVWLFGLGLRNVSRAVASRGWPSTDAVVSAVAMTSHTSRDTRERRTTTTYHADLTFRYQVDGREYATDQVRWGQTLGSGDPAEAVVLALRYPEGRRVRVHYNPAQPDEAVVRPGLTGSAFLLPGAALAFLFFLVPACTLAWRLFFSAEAGAAPPAFPALGRTMAVFLAIPILMGAAMLAGGAGNLLAGARSRHWPSTPGAWIQDLPPQQVPGIDAVRDHRGFAYVYRFESAEGPRYDCVRWFGQGTASGNDSDAEIAREFPRNQPLTVHVDPTDPDRAVLSPGIRPFAWILPGGGIGFILFGAVGMLFATRR